MRSRPCGRTLNQSEGIQPGSIIDEEDRYQYDNRLTQRNQKYELMQYSVGFNLYIWIDMDLPQISEIS